MTCPCLCWCNFLALASQARSTLAFIQAPRALRAHFVTSRDWRTVLCEYHIKSRHVLPLNSGITMISVHHLFV